MSDEPPFIKTILLVEDDSAIASRLSELLVQQAASQVLLVSDCLTTLGKVQMNLTLLCSYNANIIKQDWLYLNLALKFLHDCKPDLILLDDRLLHSNGIELGPRLVVMKDLQEIPIFVLGTDFL